MFLTTTTISYLVISLGLAVCVQNQQKQIKELKVKVDKLEE